jgi:exodeoxyribonuclease VII small subunit
VAEIQEQPVDFEKSLADLEAVVEKLEHGELGLEESLKLFERGVRLTRVCQAALQDAEQRVELLLEKGGETEIVPMNDPPPE